MAKLGGVLAALVLLTACKSVNFSNDTASSPEKSPYEIQAKLVAAGHGYYVANVDIKNSSAEALPLAFEMFTLEAPQPVTFVPAVHIRFGRPGFRIASSVPAGGRVSGEVCFGIRGGDVPTSPVDLTIRLPDGNHKFVFKVDR